MEKQGCIYMHKNIISSKSYIGQTTQGIRRRWQKHLSDARNNIHPNNHMSRAIKKYGENTWISGILEEDIPAEELDRKEIYYINKYDTVRNGYNSTIGGNNPSNVARTPKQIKASEYKPSDLTRRRMSLAQFGKKHTPATIEKLRYNSSHRSKETLKIMSEKKKGINGSLFKPWYWQRRGEEPNRVLFETLKAFSIRCGFTTQTVSKRLRKETINKYAKQGYFKDIKFNYL